MTHSNIWLAEPEVSSTSDVSELYKSYCDNPAEVVIVSHSLPDTSFSRLANGEAVTETPFFCSLCSIPPIRAVYLMGVVEPPTQEEFEGINARAPFNLALRYLRESRQWRKDDRFEDKAEPAILARPYTKGRINNEPTFVLCAECLVVVGRFINYRLDRFQRHQPRDICSVETLYAHLKEQFHKNEEGQSRRRCLDWPCNSFMHEPPTWKYSAFSLRWPPSSTSTRSVASSLEWIVAGPSRPIPSLPTYILSKLQRQSKEHDESAILAVKQRSQPVTITQQSSFLLLLAPELIQMISHYLDLPSVFSLRESCRRLASSIKTDQRFWYSRFMRNDLFGFLFNHESQDVVLEIEKRARRHGMGPSEYDWSRLVRELALYSSYFDDGPFHNAPKGFMNRRRLWKILETMEMMDETGNDTGAVSVGNRNRAIVQLVYPSI